MNVDPQCTVPWATQKALLHPQQLTTLQYRVSGGQSFVFFFQEIGVFNTLLSTSTFPQCILKNISKCIPLCFILYLLTSYVFYLFLLLYLKKQQPERTLSSQYDQAGCMVFGKVRFGISITVPRGRWTSLACQSPQREAQPQVSALHPGTGSGVDCSLITNSKPKPPPPGITSP